MIERLTLNPLAKDHTGVRFGRLVAIAPVERATDGRIIWACKCDCGEICRIRSANLLTGHTASCGCLKVEIGGSKRIHGKAGSRSYRSWQAMKKRCLVKNDAKYPSYGARGITICSKWLDFTGFYEDMGDPPVGHTLERINNDGGYNKENCTWATPYEQARNKRSTINISYQGVTMCSVDWSRSMGGSDDLVAGRIRSGWRAVDAVSTPIGGKR